VRSKRAMPESTGLNQRLHIRIEFAQAGIDSIFPKLQALNNQLINQEIRTYKELSEEDVKEQKHRLNNDALLSLGEGPEIFEGLMSSMKGSSAEKHFLSILRHFTLVENEPEQRSKYYQLINQLVAAITLDGQMGTDKDFTAQTGVTVATMFQRFETEANFEAAVSTIDELEKKVGRLERRKAELEEELAEANGGLVGSLKTQLAQMEERLRVSRTNATGLEEDQERMRQEASATTEEVRLDVFELIEMLVETEKFDEVIQNVGRYRKDRVAMVAKYKEQQERARTIRTLEGRSRNSKQREGTPQSVFEVESPDDSDYGELDEVQQVEVRKADKILVGSARRKASFAQDLLGPRKATDQAMDRVASKRSSGSQFVDADDDNVKAHIEERLATEDHVSAFFHYFAAIEYLLMFDDFAFSHLFELLEPYHGALAVATSTWMPCRRPCHLLPS
jgi:cytokinesis protein